MDQDVAAQQMASLAAQLNDPAAIIYIRDADGRYVWVSESYGRLLPFSRDQVIGRTNRELYGEGARNWEVADSFASITSDFITTAEDLYDARSRRWRKFISTKLMVRFQETPFLVGISVEVHGPHAAAYEQRLGRLRARLIEEMGRVDDS